MLEALYNCAVALLFPWRFPKDLVGRSSRPRPAAVRLFAAILLQCRKLPVARPFCDAPMKMDLRKICAVARSGYAQKYRERGLQNARRFSAKRMAEEYLALYRQLGMAA